MFECVFCGLRGTSEAASICSSCGPSKNWPSETVDQPDAVQNYLVSVRNFYFSASDSDVDKFSLRIRERLKISFKFHQLFLSILSKEKARISPLSQFKIEFNTNVADAFAGHDTYLNFRFTNISEEELYTVNLDWDDPETPDDQDLHIVTRQPIKPYVAQQIGGSHIFLRMGIKEIADLRVAVTNQFDERVIFQAASFTFTVGNPDQRITNLTHTQISIEGRGVIDASGIGAQTSTTKETGESWAELICTYLVPPKLPLDLWQELKSESASLGIDLFPNKKIEQKYEKQEALSRQEVDKLEKEKREKESTTESQFKKHTFANGDLYEGEWKNEKMHGHGKYTDIDGDIYIGEFNDGLRNGQGTYIFATGEKYDGKFKNDNFHFRGTLTFADGDKYEGEFKNGKRNGHGTLTLAGGKTIVGNWIDDKFNGLAPGKWIP